MLTTNFCIKCKIEKDINCFSFLDNSQKYGNVCSECRQEYQQQYYIKNKQKLLDKNRKYNQENKQLLAVSQKKYYEENKISIAEYQREWYGENKIEAIKQQKEYYKENRDKQLDYATNYYRQNKNSKLEYQKGYSKEKYKNDPIFKLRGSVSKVINSALKYNGNSKKGESVMKYLPYSIQDLKDHLEKQFEPWMTWNNWGIHSVKNHNEKDTSTWTWNIDHIIPQSKLPYVSMTDENFQKCWKLENLRPILSKTNLKKGNR